MFEGLNLSGRTLRLLVTIGMLVALLTALIPGAGAAAPTTVSAVSITSPTNAAKAYAKAGSTFTLNYTVTSNTAGTIEVRYALGATILTPTDSVSVVVGSNAKTKQVTVPAGFAAGMYDVQVCAREVPYQTDWSCDTQTQALVVDNTAPTIQATTLTAPNGGESLPIGGSFVIRWTPGHIVDTNLGSNPISLWLSADGGATYPTQIATGLANSGTYTWTVGGGIGTQMRVKIVATDLAGNTASDQSDANFTIYGSDSTPPVVTLTSPAGDAKIRGVYSVAANATDPDSGVVRVAFDYSTDGGATWHDIGVDSSAPFAVNWDTSGLADGTLVQVRATATNGVGASNSDTHANIMIDNSAPSVTLTDPSNGSFVGGTSVPVKANAADGQSGVTQVVFQYKIGTDPWTTIDTDTTTPYQVNWDTTSLPEGAAQLRAIATNGAGATTTSAVIGVTIDNTPPTVDLRAPNGGEVWQIGTTHEITWSLAADSNLAVNPIDLYYSNNGGFTWVLLAGGEANDGAYSWTLTGLVPGDQYRVKIEARDKAGNVGSDQSGGNFTIWGTDSTAPTVALTAPAEGAKVKGTINVAATAGDPESGIAEVTFWYSPTLGAWTPFGTDTTAPYAVSLDTTALADGPAKLKAIAKNGVGMMTSSTVVNIVVDNSAPTVNIVQPSVGAIISGKAYEIIADATDPQSGISKVEFAYSRDGATWTVIVTDTVAPYKVTWDTTTVPDGTLWIRAKAWNGVNTWAQVSNTVTVRNTASVPLSRGWNLVSLPLVPYDPTIEVVLADLIAHGSVRQVATFVWESGALVQKVWTAGPKTLTQMVDGQGYWIEMTAADELVIRGSELPAPPAPPPAYSVYTGWNLIGFKSLTPKAPGAYLGPAVAASVAAIYGYDATTGAYFIPMEMMDPGQGYWLAVTKDGTIYP